MPLVEVSSLFAPKAKHEDQYSDPRWIRRARDFRRLYGSACMSCRRSGLIVHVHHVNYERGKSLWEHEDEDLACSCEGCHKSIHNTIRVFRRIAARANASNIAAIAGLIYELTKRHGDLETALKIATLLQNEK